MKILPYNLIKDYPTSDWEKDCVRQRVIHDNDKIWKKLSKYGLTYAKTEDDKFFPTNLYIIGLGAYSVVYAISDENNYTYVLKITNNNTEINWTEQIQSLQSVKKDYVNRYVKIYDNIKSDVLSYDISGSYDDKIECSFIVLEKLYILDDNEKNLINSFDNKMYKDIGCQLFDEYIDYYEISNYINEIELSDKPLDYNLKNILDAYLKLGIDVENYEWFDYHFHNLMKTNDNNYKFIDLQSY